MINRLKGGGEKVRRTERNGLPIYHVVDDGPARAALMFRVGRGDEAAPNAGITHLVEHLALFPFGQKPYEYNGLVDTIRTVFVVAGDASEVVDHLTVLCKNLHALPSDRLETEQRVLRDEAGRRSSSPQDHHAWLRWGLHGPGLAFIPEFGLWRLPAADIQSWATTWFNANNAALVWAGPKLPAFDLTLPSGERRTPEPLVDLVREPVWAVGGPDQLAISFALTRDTPGAAAQRILGKRLQQRLRYERGLSYDVALQYQPLSAELAIATLWASSGEEDAISVRDVIIDSVRELAADGPTDEERASDLDGMRRARSQPFVSQGEADRQAMQALLGAPVETLESLESELMGASLDDMRQAFASTATTAMLTQPNGLTEPGGEYKAYPPLNPGVLAGRRFRNRWQATRDTPTLVVGDAGVSLAAVDGSGSAIAYEGVAVAVRHSRGLLAIVHENGSEIDIEPRDWVGGMVAIDIALAHIPQERLVEIENGPLDDGSSIRSLFSWIFLGYMGLISAFTFALANEAGEQYFVRGPNSILGGLALTVGAVLVLLHVFTELVRKQWAPVVGIAGAVTLQVTAVLYYGAEQSMVTVPFLGLPLVYLVVQYWRRRRG